VPSASANLAELNSLARPWRVPSSRRHERKARFLPCEAPQRWASETHWLQCLCKHGCCAPGTPQAGYYSTAVVAVVAAVRARSVAWRALPMLALFLIRLALLAVRVIKAAGSESATRHYVAMEVHDPWPQKARSLFLGCLSGKGWARGVPLSGGPPAEHRSLLGMQNRAFGPLLTTTKNPQHTVHRGPVVVGQVRILSICGRRFECVAIRNPCWLNGSLETADGVGCPGRSDAGLGQLLGASGLGPAGMRMVSVCLSGREGCGVAGALLCRRRHKCGEGAGAVGALPEGRQRRL
jgi:hypothetical protein